MKQQPILKVDAFTDRAFAGNPAGVCILEAPRSDAWMRNVAMEMSASQTAFVKKEGEGYRLRIDRSLSALSAVLGELERQKVIPIGLSTHQATLDDVFLDLTGRALKNGVDLPRAEGSAM